MRVFAHLHGISKKTYWSPGTHPAEIPRKFVKNSNAAGYSLKGKDSANGTR